MSTIKVNSKCRNPVTIVLLMCLELGFTEMLHEKYIGAIFSKQQTGFNPDIVDHSKRVMRTDQYPHLKEKEPIEETDTVGPLAAQQHLRQ